MGVAIAARYPKLLAIVLATSGCIVFAGAASAVSLLQLPAMVLAAPWALALSLLATALFVGAHARTRAGTGGIDAETERRILAVAMACRGRVTTTGVAHALSLPLVDADRALSALSRAGYLAVEADPASGVMVYVFPEIDAGLVPDKVPEAQGVTPLLAPQPAPRPSFTGLVRVSHRSKLAAAFFAICCGSIGAHKFYLGRPLAGFFYMITCWTLVPAIVGLFEGLGLLFMSDHAFDVKHNARLV